MNFSEYKYFPGTKIIGPHTIEAHGKKIYYQIISWWQNTGRSQTVRCGAASTLGGSHELGVEISELQRMTDSIEGSLGAPGLALLKSHIENTTQRQISWQNKETKSDTFTLPAPGCGSQTWVLFQLVRDYHFTIETARRLRKPKITSNEMRERTFHFDILHEDDRDDPACPCPGDRQEDRSAILSVSVGKLGMRVDAVVDEGRYGFRIGPQSYEVDAADVFARAAAVDLIDPPEIIRELSGVSEVPLSARVTLVPPFSLSDLWSADEVEVRALLAGAAYPQSETH